jgi:hypothetical protein
MVLPAAGGKTRGRLAGLAALGSVACWLLALQFANSHSASGSATLTGPAGASRPVNRLTYLTTFHAGAGDQAIAAAFRCAGLLLTLLVGVYLFSLVRARRPEVSRAMLWSGLASALLVCGATVFGYLALRGVADAFVASGPRTGARAHHLIDASGALHAAAVLDLLTRIAFAAWVGIASMEMMRVGLLDRFLAYWGFGAALSLVLFAIGDAMFIGWLGSIGIIALGYWPGGRPPAWQDAATSPPSS